MQGISWGSAVKDETGEPGWARDCGPERGGQEGGLGGRCISKDSRAEVGSEEPQSSALVQEQS